MTIIRRIRAIGGALCIVMTLVSSRTAGQELPTAKPEDVGVSPDKVEELSTFMQSLIDDGKIAGGVTMFARHGKVVHMKAVGMADREAKKPMTTDAIFRIASMTKPITSVAVMMLYDQGKLKLDDPVSKFIPDFANTTVLIGAAPLTTRPAKREITIRDLLTHTSGLGYTPAPGVGPLYVKNDILTGLCSSDLTLKEMMERVGQLPVSFDPGTQYQYGLSMDVLGRVVEVVSDKTLDDFIEKNIGKPLGMNDTFFYVPSERLSRLVPAYVPAEDDIEKLEQGKRINYHDTPLSSDYHLRKENKFLSGGGGLCSTACDYMRFCQMLLNGGELNGVRLLKEETVKLMTNNQIGDLVVDEAGEKFGFGFSIIPDSDDFHEQLRDSYKWGGFWNTHFRISPRGDWILVTMSQLAWNHELTPGWRVNYENIAAQAIVK